MSNISKLTEEMVDGPRQFILGLDLGYRQYSRMRMHLKNCGIDLSYWPKWALEEDGHITKAAVAILIWLMMEHKRFKSIKFSELEVGSLFKHNLSTDIVSKKISEDSAIDVGDLVYLVDLNKLIFKDWQ